MTSERSQLDAQREVDQIIKTARTLGVEVDETDVAQWLAAMAASGTMDWGVMKRLASTGMRSRCSISTRPRSTATAIWLTSSSCPICLTWRPPSAWLAARPKA